MDYQTGYLELIRKCDFKYEEAYAIATKKLAESYLIDEPYSECENVDYWRGIKGMLADMIATRYMLENGYVEKKIGMFDYLEKEERKED